MAPKYKNKISVFFKYLELLATLGMKQLVAPYFALSFKIKLQICPLPFCASQEPLFYFG